MVIDKELLKLVTGGMHNSPGGPPPEEPQK
ncbi:hypothetical protein N478_01950 [Pseudoalteromonas luteoviolacea S4060-1]|uniref:Uncharacterized protein n=1 Tax=Pseudoalteromonas luteoviolacea S4060-1 TaxID=1365257 RepID=A0A162B739_9GAMM|nr:hypothetical protein N478_01950 [Pseudoalteromonas luteoviolacea S4060-1]